MKIFLSFDGEISKRLADVLASWLPEMLPSVEIFFSKKDLEPGAVWIDRLSENLKGVEAGILCFTSDNLQSNWILFEAGAIATGFSPGKVFPIFFSDPVSVPAPIDSFQYITFQQNEFESLVHAIGRWTTKAADMEYNERQVSERFRELWPRLEESVKAILDCQNRVPHAESIHVIKSVREWYIYVTCSLERARTHVMDTGFGPRTWGTETIEARRFYNTREKILENGEVSYDYIASFYAGDRTAEFEQHNDTRLEMVERWLNDYGPGNFRIHYMPRVIGKERDPLLNFIIIDDEVIVGFYDIARESADDYALAIRAPDVVKLFREYYMFLMKGSKPISLKREPDYISVDSIESELESAEEISVEVSIEGWWGDYFPKRKKAGAGVESVGAAVIEIRRLPDGVFEIKGEEYEVKGDEHTDQAKKVFEWISRAALYDRQAKRLSYLFEAQEPLGPSARRSMMGFTILEFKGSPLNEYSGWFVDVIDASSDPPKLRSEELTGERPDTESDDWRDRLIGELIRKGRAKYGLH